MNKNFLKCYKNTEIKPKYTSNHSKCAKIVRDNEPPTGVINTITSSSGSPSSKKYLYLHWNEWKYRYARNRKGRHRGAIFIGIFKISTTTVPSRENRSFLGNGTTFLTFYTSSKLEKWVFQKMGRLNDREDNGTLTNLRESVVTFENRGL